MQPPGGNASQRSGSRESACLRALQRRLQTFVQRWRQSLGTRAALESPTLSSWRSSAAGGWWAAVCAAGCVGGFWLVWQSAALRVLALGEQSTAHGHRMLLPLDCNSPRPLETAPPTSRCPLPLNRLHKPAQQTALPAGAVPALLGPLPIPKLQGLGGKFGEQVGAVGVPGLGGLLCGLGWHRGSFWGHCRVNFPAQSMLLAGARLYLP